jgi:hypothetical protein
MRGLEALICLRISPDLHAPDPTGEAEKARTCGPQAVVDRPADSG